MLRTVKIEHLARSVVCFYEHTVFIHKAEVFAVFIDCRPDRNDELCSHFVKLVRH